MYTTDTIAEPSNVFEKRRVGANARPPRMRSACTECHAAKVRCSGERTGCSRCKQNSLDCHYKVSMVGRVTKRNKGNSTSTASLKSQADDDEDTEDDACLSTEPSASGPAANCDAILGDSIEAVGFNLIQPATLSAVSDPLSFPQWPSPSSALDTSDLDMKSSTLFDWAWDGPVSSTDKSDGQLSGTATSSSFNHHRQNHGLELGTQSLVSTGTTTTRGSPKSSSVFSSYGSTGPLHSPSRSTSSPRPLAHKGTTASTTDTGRTRTRVSPPLTCSTKSAATHGDHQTSLPTPAADVISRGWKPNSTNNSPTSFNHVVKLCQILRVLEAQQFKSPPSQHHHQDYPVPSSFSTAAPCTLAHPTVSDGPGASLGELMRVARACLTDTTHVMRLDDCRSCTSSSVILLSILDLMLAVFEHMVYLLGIESQCGCGQWHYDDPHPRDSEAGQREGRGRGTGGGSGGPRPMDCLLPTLQFGVFELDPEEQADLARRIVNKELQRLLGAFQTFSAHCQNLPTDNGRHMLSQWYKLLEARLERLIALAGKKERIS